MDHSTSQQEQIPAAKINTAAKTNTGHKAFLALQDELAELLVYSKARAASCAFSAHLITDEQYDNMFDCNMDAKSDAIKIAYLVSCVRKKIKAEPSREDARKKMDEFLDCLRDDRVFDNLVKSLEDNVTKCEDDPQEKQPEYEALIIGDTDISILAAASVHGLATNAYAKDLLTEAEYQYIIRGGKEAKLFILVLLDAIAQRIRRDPNVLETFITKVLDKIGPPVSALGERLREKAGPTTGMTC